MLILLVFIVGLVLLLLPFLNPLSLLVQRLLGLAFSPGIATYSKFTLRNNRKRVFNTQLSLLFGYALILFIDSIANSQSALLLINLKYYYGSTLHLSPASNQLDEAAALIAQMKKDPVLSPLSFAWMSHPLQTGDSFPSLFSQGRVVGRELKL